MKKVYTKIMDIGKNALDFLEEKMFIFFGESAQNGLEDYAVRIQMPQISEPFSVGKILHICGNNYEITAVGEKVMETFSLLGHCTVKMDGKTVADLPGTIHIKGDKLPNFMINGEIYMQ